MLIEVEPFEMEIDLGRGQEEVVVECVAALVCASLGLEVTDHSAPYIAAWGDAEEIERYAEEIDRLAGRIEAVVQAVREEDSEHQVPTELASAPA